ncbi:MAG TPA: transcription antitermination factor NusB [Planctomycetota bacterium]|nr:transcription antitermination factor NusB [Planctomycetota bacterium]
MRKRTRGRELALQLLYMVDARGDEALLGVDEFLREEAPDETEAHEFARELLSGTLDHQEEIDKAISAAAQNWNLRRMALVDRNILRMAVFEMLFAKDIPAKVSINEAIEMGKRFSTQQSGAFINGILDRIRRERDL